MDVVVSGRVPWERLVPPGFPSIHISSTYNCFNAKFNPTCPGIRKWHGQISATFYLDSDAVLALDDESQKIHFGVAPVIGVSSFPTPVRFIPNNIFPSLLSDKHDTY